MTGILILLSLGLVAAVIVAVVVARENARLVALLRVTRAERDEARREAIPATLRARAQRFIDADAGKLRVARIDTTIQRCVP